MTVVAYMTACAVSVDGGEDEREERHGWIDREWSMTSLHDSREDVEPLFSVDSSEMEELAESVRDVLGDGSLYFDNGDGTFYGQGESVEDGFSWTYAVHFSENGEPWHPERDGGISLSENGE
ncbi:hypothetical protein SEA_PATELGO_268 [Streptomyces phage Patelgo]|nr:hypothetical protein SEA_PATELGO_268 [Streptomyces phage Patelgo]